MPCFLVFARTLTSRNKGWFQVGLHTGKEDAEHACDALVRSGGFTMVGDSREYRIEAKHVQVPASYFDLIVQFGEASRKSKTPISIWAFQDAPKFLKDLCSQGGDEDWIACIPESHKETHIGFLEEGGAFGCCRVKEFRFANGATVKVGCHA